MTADEIIRDGGAKSRKLWFSIFAITVIFVGALLAAKWGSIAPLYSTMVGGVLGVVGAYLTGNVAQKLVGVKALGVTGADQDQIKASPVQEIPPNPPSARFSED